MRLCAFGDSWTEGVGGNIDVESKITNDLEKKQYRNQYAWPKVLSDLLDISHINYGEGGSSNKQIFDRIIDLIKSCKISQNDLVIVMWSSTLRDSVPFFPTDEWHVWGVKYLEEQHKTKWFTHNKFSKNPTYNEFLIDFKEFFVRELYTQNYYNIINQNYILFLQSLFEYYGINYIFCDAFDMMIDNIRLEDDKTNLINKSNYWKFSNTTFKQFLTNTNDRNVWESPQYNILNVPGMHPSKLGYKLIGEELFKFITETNIIKPTSSKQIKIL